MSATIDLTKLPSQPFSREPEALAMKCRHFGLDVKAGGNPRDGYCIYGTFQGRAIFFHTPAQVHQFCSGLTHDQAAAEDANYRVQAERNRLEDGEPRRSFVYTDAGIRRHRRALAKE